MNGLLDGKVAVISGVGPGLGREIVCTLAGQGADVALGARNTDRLAEVADEAKQLGRRVVTAPADITDPDSCAAFAAAAQEEFGRVDVLVNNAYHHGTFKGLMESDDLSGWRDAIDVNYFGTLNMTRAVVPHMRSSGGGSVVMVNTMAIQAIQARFGSYVGSKAALAGVTKTLAAELGPDHIRVNAVHPGYIWGESVRQYFEFRAAKLGVEPQQVYDEVAEETALKVLPTEQDIANAILFLASDLSKAITGIGISVNAGQFFPSV